MWMEYRPLQSKKLKYFVSRIIIEKEIEKGVNEFETRTY